MSYDLFLQGGMVIDPSQGIHRVMDVAVKGEKIVGLEPVIEGDAEEVINVCGKLVVPGLVDLHTHVYRDATQLSVNADDLCARSGVTTFVDAGSAGAGNFLGFRKHVIETSDPRIFAFLNIGFAGIFGLINIHSPSGIIRVGELCDIRLADVENAVRVGQEHSQYIVGIKVRAGSCGFPGMEPIYTARRAAGELSKPLMVHIALPPPAIDTIIPALRQGDILTHAFRPNPNSLLDSRGNPLPELVEAHKRGVIIDLGHGRGGFSFDVARQMIDAGFPPDTISTDIHAANIDGPVYDLPTTMSKMLHLGMSLEDVILAATYTPAKAIGHEDEVGSLRIGRIADISVLELVEGPVEFYDSVNERMVGKKRLICTLTIRAGNEV